MVLFLVRNIVFVTGNLNKLREARQILTDVEIVSENIDLPEFQGSPEFIAKEKARIACSMVNKPCFVEDVSNHFHALGGMPGPYIKDFIKSMKLEDIPKILSGFIDKSSTVVCSIGYCEPGKEPVCIQGKVSGVIVHPRGTSNFGWDPIFQPDGFNKTFAEMSAEEKNAISHRRLALEKFREFLEKDG